MKLDVSEIMFDRILSCVNDKIIKLERKMYKQGFTGEVVRKNSEPYRELKENLKRQKERYDNNNR